MKLTTGILVLAMSTGAGWAQNPDLIQNTKSTMNALQQKNAIDSNAALAAAGVQSSPASHNVTPAMHPSSAVPASQPAQKAPAAKNATGRAGSAAVAHKSSPRKSADKTVAVIVPKTPKSKESSAPKPVVAADTGATADAKPQDGEKEKKFSAAGKRDPFLSPVVTRNGTGSACNSTGKKCLEIGQINLKGVVRSDAGMIAVVTNSLNKAYFLRENDPVFNGYVVKITGDSITFKETFQDNLGKPLTREVVKKITTPAV